MSSIHLCFFAVCFLSFFEIGSTFNMGRLMALSNTPFNKKYPTK